jgi:hypothetical protein
MRESCFCGWDGELEDREPVLDSRGHLDDLGWLLEEAALMVWGEARHRREDPLEAA